MANLRSAQVKQLALQLDLNFADSYSQNFERAGLAQLVERAIRNRKVTGSTPVAGSM